MYGFLALFLLSISFGLRGNEQYQDLYVQGRVVQKASYGERYLEERFAHVNRILSRYKRPFTMLDIGAAQGYFSFRAAELYPQSVFVMLEGSNAVYPSISKQLSSICALNSYLDNIIWLDRSIVVEELKQLSFCEQVDVSLLLNILHWFPETWKTLLDAVKRMSHVTIVELPPWEEDLPPAQKELRTQIHRYLSEISEETWEGVPRHTNPSLKTTYYLIENKTPFCFETTTVFHPRYGDRYQRVYTDYAKKILIKERADPPSEKIVSEWVPGINLMTYLFANGAFPLRSELASRLPIDTEHQDWMPNNMIVQGKKIVLIDKNDPKNEWGGRGGTSPYTRKKQRALEQMILQTSGVSPQQVKKAFEAFCEERKQ